MSKKLIFIELNEINFDLVKKYSEDNSFYFFDTNFFDSLKITKSENNISNLEPWIQWVSAHTGLDANDHKVFRLGEINDQNIQQIFEKVESKGYSVGAICPMNTNNKLINSRYFIPDPWTKSKFNGNKFQKLIYSALSEAVNNNAGKKLTFKSKLVIFASILFFIRGRKFFEFLRLLFKSFKHKWYRAIIFDFLIHNIHLIYLNKFKVDFSTIFFNAGAHIQHHYLHNSKKIGNVFNKNPEWYLEEKFDPVLDVYLFYDKILNDYKQFKDYSILIATGLSQSPRTQKEFYYRLKDHENFLKFLNIDFQFVEPRMSRDFSIIFSDDKSRDEANEKFKNINFLNNELIFDVHKKNKSIFVSLVYNKEIKNNFDLIIDSSKKIKLINFVNFVAIKNGMHSSKGYLNSSENLKKYIPENNFHVKEIFNTISNYFA